MVKDINSMMNVLGQLTVDALDDNGFIIVNRPQAEKYIREFKEKLLEMINEGERFVIHP